MREPLIDPAGRQAAGDSEAVGDWLSAVALTMAPLPTAASFGQMPQLPALSRGATCSQCVRGTQPELRSAS